MGAQRLDGGEGPGEFGLGEGRVDLLVADMVQEHRRPALATAQFRRQVMQALRDAGRNGPSAEGAEGVIGHGG